MALYTMKWDYRFTFGKHRAERVDEVFNSGWYGKTYIAWAYYCKEDVTFVDEILEALGITQRIDKPGYDKEKYLEWLETIPKEAKEMIEEYRHHIGMGKIQHQRKVKRILNTKRLNEHEERMERISGKAYLQWKNQGH